MRTRHALAATVAGTLILGSAASAQAPPSQASPKAWDVIVTVRKDGVGADLVSFGARAAGYPPDLLRRQIVNLGERLGRGGARGVSVVRETSRPGDPSATVVRGACGVDGLIDRTNGSLALAPIAQAFAGAPAPYTVRQMLVSFDGEVPGARTIARHTTGQGSDLAFQGRLVGSSIEYDVELRSQDPARLVVNEAQAAAQASAPAAAKPPASRFDALTVALFAVAAVAAGALVYCLLLLLGRRSVAKS